MEQMIAGAPPTKKFGGMMSPEWPENILPPIDKALALKGAALYETHCEECHLPAMSKVLPEGKRDRLFTNREWTSNSAGQPILKLKVKHIGTDPAQAEDMANRTVALP